MVEIASREEPLKRLFFAIAVTIQIAIHTISIAISIVIQSRIDT